MYLKLISLATLISIIEQVSVVWNTYRTFDVSSIQFKDVFTVTNGYECLKTESWAPAGMIPCFIGVPNREIRNPLNFFDFNGLIGNRVSIYYICGRPYADGPPKFLLWNHSVLVCICP